MSRTINEHISAVDVITMRTPTIAVYKMISFDPFS
jgi:hypothetical protein